MKNMNIYHQIENDACKLIGSRAETPAGRARALTAVQNPNPISEARTRKESEERWQWSGLDRLAVGSPVPVLIPHALQVEGYAFFPLTDRGALARAKDHIGTQGQVSNFSDGRACVGGIAYQPRWERIRYGGKWLGKTGWMLYWDYQSCIGISRSGRSAVIIRECVLRRRIVAPKGMLFSSDAVGVKLVRQSDKMDYHPTHDDWYARDFAGRCRLAMARNYAARAASRRARRQAEHDMARYQRQTASTWVTLQDSRQAGNCVEGSLAYAEQRLRVPRESVIAGLHLFSVPATTLRATADANGDAPRVEAAIQRAWMRETAVCI